MHIDRVPPNNIAAARQFYRESVADGTWDSDAAEMLLNRQDNPSKVIAMLVSNRADDWDEGAHPRAPDGKFGEGGGGASGAHAERARVAAIVSSEKGKPFPEHVQQALRAQTSATVSAMGIHPSGIGINGPMIGVVTVKPDSAMPGVSGEMRASTGEMVLSASSAANVQEFFASDPIKLGQSLEGARRPTDYPAGRVAFAQHVMVHEHIHACGPGVFYNTVGVVAEEVTTEMCARAVMGKHLGLDSTAVRGSYPQYIFKCVTSIQKNSGASPKAAYKALEHASLEFKRQPHDGKEHSGAVALSFLAKTALEHLGVHDSEKHTQTSEALRQIYFQDMK